jgi:hypothetical protein
MRFYYVIQAPLTHSENTVRVVIVKPCKILTIDLNPKVLCAPYLKIPDP